MYVFVVFPNISEIQHFKTAFYQTYNCSKETPNVTYLPELVLRISLDDVFPRCISDAAWHQQMRTLRCLSLIRTLRVSAPDTKNKQKSI